MAKYKAKGTISWFDYGELKARFNADTKLDKRNIFLEVNDVEENDWGAVALDSKQELGVDQEIKEALWNIAQKGSQVIIYIEKDTVVAPKENKVPGTKEDKGSDKKDSPRWMIKNIALENKNEDE